MLRNVLEYLEETVQRFPDKVAFANESMGMTFREVYQGARSIGSGLLEKGYGREPVVIYMQKHPHMITAFWGVVYSGCFYVPMDEEMPKFRAELIFQNLKPRAVICDETTAGQMKDFPDFDGEVLLYEEISQHPVREEALAQVRRRAIDTDPVYIVFTSGSTGVPKGVAACHRSVIDYVESLTEVLQVTEDSVFANQTPLYFDACLKELFSTLKYGATTYLVPKSLFMFPIKLVEFLNEYKINTVCWVVSALTMISSMKTFDKVKPEYLHTVAFGSEVFPIKQFNLWRQALPKARFINLYGPTEATGMSCYYEVDREFQEGDAIPIGRPFKNTEILLLDENNQVPPQGEPGEMCIRGTAVTLGYYNNFEKTNEVFVQNPLNSSYHELIYRTGDIGKLNQYGELVFISRKDYQIKHMGHRIELGEIEVHVNMIEGIHSACCIYDKEKEKIVLFYVGETEKKALVTELKKKLPRYMIPNQVYEIPRMPLTANGKIDRVKLKEINDEEKRRK
ncbi:MAG TPA: amino acid adenylation domain-containing protein [Candidatus Blautia pullicola]|uniref:Amino acid adenylation domain-containing protein n=1 Tax=Candidatus Blautia pullicola TaxID=2838498 RepID=A0A9D2FRA3_9FIRM|nr:amino acid adenylation domain-containing protein [Candidatus Blautia pullicola]